ncbi:hypothetical protein KIF59_21840 [Enterobacter cloacae subsp. cloacae]|nr:hypothetical protein [Enterobacter cloacae subsp. cloacae]
MRCWGWGDAAAARKDNDAAERYYRRALRMDSGNSNAVRGLANIYRTQSPEKACSLSSRSPPVSVAALMILNVA